MDAIKDEMRDDFRGVLEKVLTPAYPKDASIDDKLVHNQNSRDQLA